MKAENGNDENERPCEQEKERGRGSERWNRMVWDQTVTGWDRLVEEIYATKRNEIQSVNVREWKKFH